MSRISLYPKPDNIVVGNRRRLRIWVSHLPTSHASGSNVIGNACLNPENFTNSWTSRILLYVSSLLHKHHKSTSSCLRRMRSHLRPSYIFPLLSTVHKSDRRLDRVLEDLGLFNGSRKLRRHPFPIRPLRHRQRFPVMASMQNPLPQSFAIGWQWCSKFWVV
jgi:hypothetical protein